MYQVIYLNADKTLNLLEIALTRQDGNEIAFPIVDSESATEHIGATAYLSENDRLVLGLPKDQKLLPGDQGVKLSLSWTASLRKDGKGNAYISKPLY